MAALVVAMGVAVIVGPLEQQCWPMQERGGGEKGKRKKEKKRNCIKKYKMILK